MKNSKSLIILIAVLFSLSAQAAIWRVNNKSNYNAAQFKYGENYGGNYDHPVFKEISDAMPPASNRFSEGDTIHVEGSDLAYANTTLYHRATLIGPGYFLGINPKSSANYLSATIQYISFQTGSQGSILIGMTCTGGAADYIKIWVDSITIRRCFIARSIHITGNLAALDISQNFFTDDLSTEHILDVDGAANVTDLTFNNNICQRNLDWGSQFLQCNNNTFDCADISVLTQEFYNNIIVQGTSTISVTPFSSI